MKEIICPICGKNDIPDFHSQDVVCPCCGSDLSIYRLVEQIETGVQAKPEDNKKTGKATLYATAALAVALLLVSVFMTIRTTGIGNKLEASKTECMTLAEENAALKATLDEAAKPVEQIITSSAFKYVVRQGDSFWTISRKLYGTGSRYKEIAEANNLDVNAVLNVGDELIIK